MRSQQSLGLAAIFSASVVLTTGGVLSADAVCGARVERIGATSLQWVLGAPQDRAALDRWCRAVGPAVYVPRPVDVASSPPSLDDVVVLTWNAHLAEGRLTELIAALRKGWLTGGVPVHHFVLLVQEMFRRGPDVPAFAHGMRSAHAIRPRQQRAPDVNDYAAMLGLSLLYVPSMRNGRELEEDRGNAIISTEPLSSALALELPFERQRRVAVSAAIDVMVGATPAPLRVMNVHLEPLSSPQSLWVLRNPRGRQMRAVLSLLSNADEADTMRSVGTVLGGDLNTIQSGPSESAYKQARTWSTGVAREDTRTTHLMGRLDYLFFRLPSGVTATAVRIDDKFGSDHHPVLGRFSLAPHKIPG